MSSGLGGRFPKGYPVAEVSDITKEPGAPFVTISATPMAHLSRSKLVLVVFSEAGAVGPEQLYDQQEPDASESEAGAETEGESS